MLLGDLSTDEGENVSAGGFEFGNVVLHPSTEEGVEGHRNNTNNQPRSRGDEGFPDSLGQFELFGPLYVAVGNLHEGFDHSDDSSKKADHGGDSTNVGEVADSLTENATLSGSFGLGDFPNFGATRGGVLCEEIESLLSDASDRFVATMAICNEAEIIAFSNHGLGVIHKLIGDHRAAAQGQEIEEDQNQGENGKRDERCHHPTAFREEFDNGEIFFRGLFGSRSQRRKERDEKRRNERVSHIC